LQMSIIVLFEQIKSNDFRDKSGEISDWHNWRFLNFWLEIFYRRIWCMFLLLIDVLRLNILTLVFEFVLKIEMAISKNRTTHLHFWWYLWNNLAWCSKRLITCKVTPKCVSICYFYNRER
jgi:hypothetical protein